MTLLTAVEFLLKLRNRLKQPESAFQLTQKEIASMAISLFFCALVSEVDLNSRLHANIPLQACCAPVAQRIEHLPCWSLSEEWFRGTR